MTLRERSNYGFAVFLSILLHLFLLFVSLPVSKALNRNFEGPLDTITPGLMEFPSGVASNAAPAFAENGLNLTTRVSSLSSEIIPPNTPASKQSASPLEPEKQMTIELKKERSKEKTVPSPGPVAPIVSQSTEKAGHEIATHSPGLSGGGGGGSINGKPGANNGKSGIGPAGKADGTGLGVAGKSLGSGEKLVLSGGTAIQMRYPKNAENEGKEGEVGLRVLMNTDGSQEDIKLTQPTGDTRLDNAAIRFIRQYYKFRTNAEKYSVNLIVVFKLGEDPFVRFVHSETRL